MLMPRIAVAALIGALPAACAHSVAMRIEQPLPSCRAVVGGSTAVQWIMPFSQSDRMRLRSWCDAVGPVATYTAERPASTSRAIAIVSWNMAVGGGDLIDLVADVSAANPGADLVLILQEAYRAGAAPECPKGSGSSKAIGSRGPASADIMQLAENLRLHALYAPSMRNGQDCSAAASEDRGNAILSTLPIDAATVIELPFAQERRAAIAAVIRGSRPLTVISVHFDTLRGHRRMAEGIKQSVEILRPRGDVVIGGDFNSALPLDGGMRVLQEHFSEVDCGGAATHQLGTRLDHLFINKTAPPLSCVVMKERYGSDHHALVAKVPE